MKYYLKSSFYLPGLALSVSLVAACSSGIRPAPPSQGNKYSGDSNETPEVPTDENEGEALPGSPVPQPASPANPARVPASISVSLSALTLATPGESYFPRGVKMPDGSLITSYGQDINGEHTLKTEISNDEGRTWRELGQIVSEAFVPDGGEVVGDPTLGVLPSGTMLSIYRSRNAADGTFFLQASASFDGGKNWVLQGNIDVGQAGGRGKQATMLVNSKGQAQVYYAKEKAGGFEDLFMRTSPDEGKTWSAPTIVATRSAGHSSFPGATRLKDGSILVVFDTFRGDNVPFQILRSVQSNNDGLTWTAPKDVYIPAGGDRRAQSPQITILDDGRPIVLFMSNEDPTTGFVIKLMIAQDVATFDKLQWLPQPVLAVNDAIAPAAIPLKDGDFILTYERNRRVFFNQVSVKGGL